MWTWCKSLLGRMFNLMVIKESEIDIRQYSLQVMLDDAHVNLKSAYSRFAIADDPDLIDCAIYNIKAAEKRYEYILKQFKHNQNQVSLH